MHAGPEGIPLELSTKYYAASLLLRGAHLHDLGGERERERRAERQLPDDPQLTPTTWAWEACDAFIFLLAPPSSSTPSRVSLTEQARALRHIHAAAVASSPATGPPSILLCVAWPEAGAAPSSAPAEVHDLEWASLRTWCIEQGWELVEGDKNLAPGPTNPHGPTSGDREVVGLERVREALAAHMWDGHARHPSVPSDVGEHRAPSPLPPGLGETGGSNDDDEEEEEADEWGDFASWTDAGQLREGGA